jgi:hypothetical protein
MSLSLLRGIRRPYACVRPLGCGFLRPGKAGPETPEDGSGAEVAASWSRTSRCHPNRGRFARHDRRLRLGGEAGVAGPDVRPKPRATEGVTQALAPAIPGRGRETWPSRRPPHTDRVPAIPRISRDVASPGLCWPAGRSTSPKLEKQAPQRVSCRRAIAHRGSSHLTATQPTLNDKARRNPTSVFGTCLPRRGRPFYGIRSREAATPSSHRPIAGNRGLIRPSACRRAATLTWEGGPTGKMVAAGALPPPHIGWQSARRPLPPSAPRVRTPRWLRTNTLAGGLHPAGSAAAQFSYRPRYRRRRGRSASSRLCLPANRD